MINLEIKDEIIKSRVKMWEIAEKMGITDSSLSRKFRKELSDHEKQKIRAAIEDLKAGVENVE